MKEILEIHARNLSKPFDKMWIGRFRAFLRFVQTNPETQKTLASFHEEKLQNHAAFIDASSKFTKELNQYWNKVKKNILPDEIISFEEKLKALQKLGREIICNRRRAPTVRKMGKSRKDRKKTS